MVESTEVDPEMKKDITKVARGFSDNVQKYSLPKTLVDRISTEVAGLRKTNDKSELLFSYTPGVKACQP